MAETVKTVKDVADDGEWMVREQLVMIKLEWKHLLNVSDMRGKLSLWISLFYYDSLQGFYTMLMSTLQVRSLCVFTKGMRGWAYENKKKGE
jgi:hypothetical protein